jgi:hypothetical protein
MLTRANAAAVAAQATTLFSECRGTFAGCGIVTCGGIKWRLRLVPSVAAQADIDSETSLFATC